MGRGGCHGPVQLVERIWPDRWKYWTTKAARRTAMIPVRKIPSKTPAPPMDLCILIIFF